MNGDKFSITIDESVESNATLHGHVRERSKDLFEILNDTRVETSAIWSLGESEQGQPHLNLKLKDTYGEVDGRYTADDLILREDALQEFYRLRGDLFRNRSKKQLQALFED